MRFAGLVLATFYVAVWPLPAEAQSHRIGEDRTGSLIYEGRISERGADELIELLERHPFVVFSSINGDVSAANRLVSELNIRGHEVESSSRCFGACAMLILAADRGTVAYGSTLLFTSQALTESAALDLHAGLLSCLAPAGSKTYWVAPEVLAALGYTNVDVKWVLERSARTSYEELIAGRSITWIDTVDQCKLD